MIDLSVGEEAVDGVCVHDGLSIESSQYSSEVINTQVSTKFYLPISNTSFKWINNVFLFSSRLYLVRIDYQRLLLVFTTPTP